MAGQIDEDKFKEYLANLEASGKKIKQRGLLSGYAAPGLSKNELSELKAQDFANNVEKNLGKTGAAIGAGSESALNSALFGVPEALMKVGDGQAYKNYLELKNRHKGAALAGDIGGAFIPTGGALLKGAGYGLKAAGNAGKIANVGSKLIKAGQLVKDGGQVGKLGKIGSGVVRGALTSAEQLAPRVAFGQIDPLTAGTELGLGAAFGGGMGAVAEGASRIPEVMKSLSKWGNKTILKNADVTTRIMRGAEKYGGNDPAEFVKELAEYAKKNELQREPKLDALVKRVKETWNTIGTNFDKSGYKLADDVDNVLTNPNIQETLSREPGSVGAVIDLLDKVDRTPTLAKKRAYLNKVLYDMNTPIEQKNIARGVMDSLEGKAESLSGLDTGKAKYEWKMMKPFEAGDIRDELNTSASGLARGSDTVAKLALGGIGATTGASGNIKGVLDDPTDPSAWGKLITATVGGSLTGAFAKNLSYQAAKLATKLDPDDIARLIKGGKFDKIAQLASQIDVGKVTGKAISPFSRAIADINAEKYAGEELEQTPPTMDGVDTKMLEAEAPKPNDLIMEKITKKLFKDYAENFADQMSFDDFYAQAERLTDGFQPTKAAKILYRDPKQRAKFIKDYSVSQKIKNADIEKAFKKRGFIENLSDSGGKAEQQVQQNDIIDSIAGLVAQNGGIASDQERKAVVNDINAIMALKSTPEVKKGILIDKLAKYGVDIETLRGMGLV